MTMHEETYPAMLIGGPHDGLDVDVTASTDEVQRVSEGTICRYKRVGQYCFRFEGGLPFDPADFDDAGIELPERLKTPDSLLSRLRDRSSELADARREIASLREAIRIQGEMLTDANPIRAEDWEKACHEIFFEKGDASKFYEIKKAARYESIARAALAGAGEGAKQ